MYPFNATLSRYDIGNASGSTNSFMRFSNVSVPKDATIISAEVRMTANHSSFGGVVNVRIRAIASDNASAPTSTAAADSVSRTSAKADWFNVSNWSSGTVYDSPDIKSILQEMV